MRAKLAAIAIIVFLQGYDCYSMHICFMFSEDQYDKAYQAYLSHMLT